MASFPGSTLLSRVVSVMNIRLAASPGSGGDCLLLLSSH